MRPHVGARKEVPDQPGLRARLVGTSWPGPGLSTLAKVLLALVALGLGLGVAYEAVQVAWPVVHWLESPYALPFWLSVKVSLAATLLAAALGTASGYGLAKSRVAGRDALEAAVTLPVVLPPTVVGYYLLQLLGGGTTGRMSTALFGHHVPFSVTACVIAATVAAFPFVLRASRAAFQGVDTALEQSARTLGLPEWQVALKVSLPVARRGIGAGIALASVRALGEYGATLMLGGDLGGRTETMPIAVAGAFTSTQTHHLVAILGSLAIVLLLVALKLEGPCRLTHS